VELLLVELLELGVQVELVVEGTLPLELLVAVDKLVTLVVQQT
jgi:hypothetical protein